MKDLKVLSSSIHPGVGHESIHNTDSINTALLGIYTKNVITGGYHLKCVYTLSPPDVTAYVYVYIVCKNLETEGSKGLGTTTYAHGVVITNTKGIPLLVWSYNDHCSV